MQKLPAIADMTPPAKRGRRRRHQTLAIWGGAFSALHACVSGCKFECYNIKWFCGGVFLAYYIYFSQRP
jgi:hypothetical protein